MALTRSDRRVQISALHLLTCLVVGVLSLSCAPVLASETAISETFRDGIRAYRSGSYTQAISHFNRALQEDPHNANLRYYLAISLDRLQREEEAAVQYEYVVKRGGTDDRVRTYAHSRLQAIQSPRYLATATAATPSAAVSDRLKGQVSKVLVPLKDNRNALMVDADLHNEFRNRQASGTFIIDTGATYTSISREMAENLGLNLDRAEKITITTANGRIEVPKVTIDRLIVNGLEARDVQATVIQVRHGSSFSGLLGLSFLRQFVLTIDPEAGHLIFQQ